MNWTTEQVLALAPSQDGIKDAKKLADARKWVLLGCDDQAVWGECKGSASKPYQTEIDLTGPGFHCSCPSRKFPCKHSLALFLLYADHRQDFTQNAPPTWVTDWINGRRQREQQKAARQQNNNGQIVDPAAQAKRADKRQAKVEAGLTEIDLWLTDIVRGGLAAVQGKPYGFWDNPAARMVDAQAPGIARRVREMAGIPTSGEGWPERLLQQMGQLHLLLQGYQHLDTLSPTLQADIRAGIGWTLDQNDLLNEPPVRDYWTTLGQRFTEEERLRARSTWLIGQQTGRCALLLDFAYAHQSFDLGLPLNLSIEADMVFYPSAYPLRAILKNRYGVPMQPVAIPGHTAINAAVEAYTSALSCNPWLERFPVMLQGIIPISQGDTWAVRDSEGQVLTIAPQFGKGWELLALSGGHPVDVFGEWDGNHFLPLSVWADNRFVRL